jgi:hypothetical protein
MTSVQQPFPRLSSEFVEPNRLISIPWHKLLITLWQRTGGSIVPASGSVSLYNTGSGIQAIDNASGTVLGFVYLASASGGPAVNVPATGTGQVYQAAVPGTLVVFGAKVELSRDGGANYFSVTLQGGALPMLVNDKARMTWFNPATPPIMTWFPSTT